MEKHSIKIRFNRKATYSNVRDFVDSCYQDIRNYCFVKDRAKQDWEDHAQHVVLFLLENYKDKDEVTWYYWFMAVKNGYLTNFKHKAGYVKSTDLSNEETESSLEELLGWQGAFTKPETGVKSNMEEFKENHPELFELAYDIMVDYYPVHTRIPQYLGKSLHRNYCTEKWRKQILPQIITLLK